MASGDSGNLVQEFEEAFQRCISSLTEEDDLNEKDSDSNKKNIEEKISQFTDIARQLETFFLGKRFLIYNHKPEYILKEDTNDLKAELVRKDELIRKHYEKLGQWQNMLADVQVQSSGSGGTAAAAGGTQARGQTGPPGALPTVGPSDRSGPQAGPLGAGPTSIPGPGGPTPHGGFVPGNNYSRMPGQPPQMFGGPGGQQGGQQNLQGPLAYLERTTSNIGGGMGGGPGPMGMNNR